MGCCRPSMLHRIIVGRTAVSVERRMSGGIPHDQHRHRVHIRDSEPRPIAVQKPLNVRRHQQWQGLSDFFQWPVPPRNLLQHAPGRLIKSISDMPRRHPAHDRIRRDFFRDHASCSNHCTIPNRDSRKDHGSRAYPHIMPDHHPSFSS